MPITTQSGVTNEFPASDFSFEDAMLSRWSEEDPAKAQVSEDPEGEDLSVDSDEDQEQEVDETEENDEETDTDPEESDTEETEEETEEDAEEKPTKGKILADDSKVKLKVDGEELEVSVKDLTRLYGQEAALTKKSQQVAAQRKEAEAANTKAAAQLDRIYQKVSARWEPYAKIDMLVASTQLDAESFAALRAEAQSAYDDYRFITQEVDQFVETANTQRQQSLQEQAKEAVKVLKDVIPNWSQSLYDEIRTYAVDKGMDVSVINQLVDPAALQLIHKAMQYDKAKTIKTKKVVTQPKKVLKTTKPVTASDSKSDKTTKAQQRLKHSGSTEDAADLFMARWSND